MLACFVLNLYQVTIQYNLKVEVVPQVQNLDWCTVARPLNHLGMVDITNPMISRSHSCCILSFSTQAS